MTRNIPNILTFFRIAILPIIIALFFVPEAWAAWTALGLYTLACITDFLDGYIARKMQIVSAMGTFLDPIADKIFIASLLIVMAGFGRLDGFWLIAAIIILSRELLVSGLREFLGPMNIQLPVSKLAKWKTTVQMIALGFLVVGDYGDVLVPYTLEIGQYGLAIAAILTVMTGWAYLKAGLKHI
jgi:cardiolipin synthase